VIVPRGPGILRPHIGKNGDAFRQSAVQKETGGRLNQVDTAIGPICRIRRLLFFHSKPLAQAAKSLFALRGIDRRSSCD
jgi:hypothetical protein